MKGLAEAIRGRVRLGALFHPRKSTGMMKELAPLLGGNANELPPRPTQLAGTIAVGIMSRRGGFTGDSIPWHWGRTPKPTK
jgi:hypothetical protein